MPSGVIGERLGDHADGLDLEARGLVLFARGVQELDGLAHLGIEMRRIDADKCGDGADLGLGFGEHKRSEREGEEEDFPHGTVIPCEAPNR